MSSKKKAVAILIGKLFALSVSLNLPSMFIIILSSANGWLRSTSNRIAPLYIAEAKRRIESRAPHAAITFKDG